jgi:hypothetical protein
MAAPKYFIENRYSFVVDALPRLRNAEYEVDTPETAFERDVQLQLATANRLLMAGKYSAALDKYRHLRGLIAAVIHPHLSVLNASKIDWTTISKAEITDTVVAKSAQLLKNTPVLNSTFPQTFRGSEVTLPDPVAKQFAAFAEAGVKDRNVRIGALLDEAGALIDAKDFAKAADVFQSAFNATEDRNLQGALLHDMGVMQERSGSRDKAIATLKRGAGLFEQQNNRESQAQVLTALAATQARGGSTADANATLKQANDLRQSHNLFPVITERASSNTLNNKSLETLDRRGIDIGPITSRPILTSVVTPVLRGAAAVAVPVTQVTEEFKAQPVELMATEVFATRKTQKQLTVLDSANKPQRVQLDGTAAQSLTTFYQQLSATSDLKLLMGYLDDYTITIAYLTHVYYWIIPMAIGDCHAALGSYAEAETEYLSTLNYKFLNQVVESVNLWLRLAELYLDWGDRLYRQARNVVAEFAQAKQKYELIMRLNNTIDQNSSLYKNQKFAQMRNRANAVIQARFVNNTAIAENPRLTMVFFRARMQLTKIANELNFIGLGVHIPPFSFEYLQNLARYFTQHASQVEQMYIQFKSTGENEELREQQLAQQAEVAAASVELEERGLDEAREGVDVAQANLNHANVQAQNAVQSSNDFNNVRWELLELDTLNAWASASAVDRDDQVKLTITGYTYYGAEGKRRNVVLKELAAQRTRITHELEENRLQREINAANAYRGVAQQQVQQAQARVAIAQQRVAIAEMQEQHARENLEFLEGREFTSAMWYNLARESRRLAGRYLDMAIEVATLMEKAYEAETGRDLRKIKFEYGLNHLNGLLGAEALLLDIDFFTLDYVRTKSKKAQMRQTLSMADMFPMAFNRLLQTGRTFFETTLDHFDRRYPGFYLQKLKQVEVVFVGLNGNEGVHGTLSNIGLSQFRRKSGAIVNQTYPADVMPLSEYNVRQDAVVFQLDSKELRLFENNGVATMWELKLPLATNTFDLRQILDVQLVVYYDGFFDAGLEQKILNALPSNGSASRGLSLRMFAPDELFFLRSQGTAELRITPDLFPANHTNQRLSSYFIQAQGANVGGLQVKIDFANLGTSHTFKLDANGTADGAAFPAPVNRSLFENWTITIDPAANPGFDVSGLTDFSVFVEYDFDYRS